MFQLELCKVHTYTLSCGYVVVVFVVVASVYEVIYVCVFWFALYFLSLLIFLFYSDCPLALYKVHVLSFKLLYAISFHS